MKQYIVLQPWVDDKQYKPGDIVTREEADAEGLNAFIPGMLAEVTDAPGETGPARTKKRNDAEAQPV